MHTRMHTCGGTRSSLPLPMFLTQSVSPAASSCLPLPWLQQSRCVLVPLHLLNTAAVEPKRKKIADNAETVPLGQRCPQWQLCLEVQMKHSSLKEKQRSVWEKWTVIALSGKNQRYL